MSEFIAEAQVLVVPNTAGFRAELQSQLLAATKGVVVPVNVVATGAGISGAVAATESLTVVSKEAAAAQSQAGAAATKNAIATTQEAKASTLAAAAAKSLAVAQSEVEGAATGVASAQIRNTRSAAALADAEKALAGALASQNLNLEIAAAGHLELAAAEHASALGALESARAQAKTAATSSQVQRAFLAQAAGAAGLRGAVLSSTAAFLGATVAAVALGKAIKGASDLNEEINKTEEVFGASSVAIEEWSKTTASGIGIAEVEALQAIGTFGELFRTLGVGTPKAAALSKQLVTLGADLASFFNKSPEQALQAIQSGLVGQARPLRQFGIFLTEARVKAEALIETGKKNVDSLSQQDRILARYNLILQDAAIASGDFERTQERLANQGRIFRANISDLGDEIGNVFLPNIEAAIQDVNKLFFALGKLKDFKAHITLIIESQIPGGKDGITAKVLGFAAGFLGPGGILKANLLGLRAVGKALDFVGLSGKHAGKDLEAVALANREIARDAAGSAQILEGLAAALERAAAAAGHLNSRLKIQALTLEAGQAPLSVRIAKQKEIVENDKKLVEEARHTGKAANITDALNQQIADQNELESLQNEVVSNQEQAAASAQAAAQKAQENRDKQFQALADLFSGRQATIEKAISRAEDNENFANAKRFNTALIKSLKKELDALRERLKTIKVSAELRKSLFKAITDALEAAKQDRIRFQAEQQQKILDRLDFRVSLAQARDNTAAELKARRARLEEITNQLAKLKNANKKNTDRWRELKLAQAEEIAAIKELEGQNKEKQGAQKSLFFQFLQTQQGFAANLLGNLIPGFATAGLVGGSQAAAAGGEGLRQVAGGFEQPRGGVQGQAALAAGRDRGVRPVQVDTTNHLLRQILRSLQNLNGRASHPEARYQNRVAGSNMDTIGGV